MSRLAQIPLKVVMLATVRMALKADFAAFEILRHYLVYDTS